MDISSTHHDMDSATANGGQTKKRLEKNSDDCRKEFRFVLLDQQKIPEQAVLSSV